MHKKIFILVLFSFLFYAAAQAQEKKYVYQDSSLLEPQDSVIEDMQVHEYVNTAEEDPTDTTLEFSKLVISTDSIQNWKNLKAFAYAKYLDSLLKARQEKQPVERSESSGPGWLDNLLSSSATRIFFWLVAAVFILFILYRLFLAKGVFTRNVAITENTSPEVKDEQITSDSDLESLIRQAVLARNYRLAIRYQYLRTLRKLAAKHIIEMAADKTNYQYVREISDNKYRNDFAALTLSYEYAWYGEFAVEEDLYHRLERSFSGFNQKL